MIFVTVGYQMAFDRLIEAVDEWAGAHPDAELFAYMSKCLKGMAMEYVTNSLYPVCIAGALRTCSVGGASRPQAPSATTVYIGLGRGAAEGHHRAQ